MNLKLGIKWNVNRKLIEEQAKKVLFECMLKMQELATINCPWDTGRLSTAINIYPTSPGFREYLLYDDVEYAEAIEFGTDPYIIKVKNKKVLANKKKGLIFGKSVKHPGTNAQPFFRPALIQVKNVWVKRYWEKNFSK